MMAPQCAHGTLANSEKMLLIAFAGQFPCHTPFSSFSAILRPLVDLNELLKAAPQLQSIATTIVAGVPLAEIVKRIVLPSADVLGKRMADRVERCFAKTAKMIEDAGVTPQPVEDKLVVEILQGASLEANESLQDMWAALLANAGSAQHDTVRPRYVEILRQMAPDEAALLNWIYDEAEKSTSARDVLEPYPQTILVKAYASLGFGSYDPNPPPGQATATVNAWKFGSCFNSLEAAQLIRTRDDVVNPSNAGPYFSLTYLGVQFVRACRPPKPKD